jgi:signal transduction histidine kinase
MAPEREPLTDGTTGGFEPPTVSRTRSIAVELGVGLGGLVVILSLIALWTVGRLSHATERYTSLTQVALDDLLLAERLRLAVERTSSAARGYLLSENAEFLTKLRRSESSIDELLAERRAKGTVEQAAHDELRRVLREYRQGIDATVARKSAGAPQPDVIDLFERDMVPHQDRLDNALTSLSRSREARLTALRAEVRLRRADALTGAIVTIAFGILASILLATLLGRHLTKIYRRERLALEAAERATAARKEILAIVAHDLRSPLSAISLRASMLRRDAVEDRVRRHGEAIGRVVASTERLLRSLLDLARIDAGRFALDLAPCPADGLLRELVDVHEPLAAAKSLHLDCNPADANFEIRVDRERLLQVLSNLVGNAIKFAPPQSTIEIVLRTIDREVHFSVQDHGPGIPPEDLPFIFDRFWRGKIQGSKGIGLGLYIARRVVEAHGGRVWADSRAGEGTCFHVVLPVADSGHLAGASAPNKPKAINT